MIYCKLRKMIDYPQQVTCSRLPAVLIMVLRLIMVQRESLRCGAKKLQWFGIFYLLPYAWYLKSERFCVIVRWFWFPGIKIIFLALIQDDLEQILLGKKILKMARLSRVLHVISSYWQKCIHHKVLDSRYQINYLNKIFPEMPCGLL